ncbi:hypothetical protein HRV97_06470 [Sphingomonas sp. HHU CXW]|uniref:Uncharacterized protein n=1 Tax=Sphingomonas hominis TaxID=2741495 RepID=A0ABX2JH73_9SPHN|nr:hypothetical protein [Sphingomonas hominis]NTS64800.1 hypothetical protein [Sphingomonas hominis]
MSRTCRYLAPFVQLAGGVVALVAFAVAPPERGDLLYVPLTAAAAPAQAARADGSALLGRGPFGSVVVRASAPHDLLALLRAGILVTAAPAALCGTVRA